MIGMPLRPIMAGIQSTPDRITIVSTNRGRTILIEKEREEVGMASRFHVKTFSSSIQHQMFQHNSRGRPLNAPAAFIHPCQPIVVAQPPSDPGWAHELKHDGYRLQIGGLPRTDCPAGV